MGEQKGKNASLTGETATGTGTGTGIGIGIERGTGLTEKRVRETDATTPTGKPVPHLVNAIQTAGYWPIIPQLRGNVHIGLLSGAS